MAEKPNAEAAFKDALTGLVRFAERFNLETIHGRATANDKQYHVVVTQNPHFVQLLEALSVYVPDAKLSEMLFQDHGIGKPPEGGFDV